jgi:hypothetical protein
VLRDRQYRCTCSDDYRPSIPIIPQHRQRLLDLKLSENVEEGNGKYKEGRRKRRPIEGKED